MSLNDIKKQGIASYVTYLKSLRFEELLMVLKDISSMEAANINTEDEKLLQALIYVDKVRDFIDNPNNILGSNSTKHGEIAEHVDVCIRNATRALDGLKADATFENVGRIAPEDYIVAAQEVQSKFYNGINNTLKAVLDHHEKYSYFGSNGKSYYVIPKDQYEVLLKVQNGEKTIEFNGQRLTLKTINKAKELIEQIEKETNRPFSEVTQSSSVNYSEVQLGNLGETLENQEIKFNDISNVNKENIKQQSEINRHIANEQAQPTLIEGTKVAGIAAALGGGFSLAFAVYEKKKNGIELKDFTAQDWKDVGIDTGIGALKGGVSGYSIYYLVNMLEMPAPLAGAYVSAVFGIVSIANQFRKGEIEIDDYVELSHIVCLDSAITAVGAAIGQAVIPVPVLGAVIGSVVTSMVSTIAKEYLNTQEDLLIQKYQQKFNKEMELMNEEDKISYERIMSIYNNFGMLTEKAFDFNSNNELRFNASIDLAELHGVEHGQILDNVEEFDKYFCD